MDWSVVWVIMVQRGYSQNAGILVVLVISVVGFYRCSSLHRFSKPHDWTWLAHEIDIDGLVQDCSLALNHRYICTYSDRYWWKCMLYMKLMKNELNHNGDKLSEFQWSLKVLFFVYLFISKGILVTDLFSVMIFTLLVYMQVFTKWSLEILCTLI